MMRMNIAILAFLAACNPSPPAVLTEADLAAIRKVSDDFTKHIVASDWGALMKLYTEDAIVMPPGAPAAQGRAAIEAFLVAFPKVTEMDLALEEIEGRGDLAFVRGTYTMTLEIPGAPGPMTDKGKYLEIRRKQADGSWLLGRDIFNSNSPPPAPPPPEPASTSGT
ncbi:MAG: YybH family protein [Vicinamibacteria bacterium]